MTGYILEKVEDAWVNYLASSSLSASVDNFYRGMGFVEKTGNSVIVFAPACEELEVGSGVYRSGAQIQLIYSFEDSGSISTRNSTVTAFNNAVLGNSDLISVLAGSTNNLRIYDINFAGQNNSFSDECMINTINVSMVVVAI